MILTFIYPTTTSFAGHLYILQVLFMKHPYRSHFSQNLKGTPYVPSDKSISHRALLCGLLSVGSTHITNLLQSEDVKNTQNACQTLGARITQKEETTTIKGVGVGGLQQPATIIDVGNSGTTTRLLSGILATHPITTFLNGDTSLNKRPMERIITPLSAAGAQFITPTQTLPMGIIGTNTPLPLQYKLPIVSAQVKSALLFAALATRGITRITETIPTRDHTERMLQKFGVPLDIQKTEKETIITIHGPCTLTPQHITIPSDISSALFIIVAALICPQSHITLHNISANPTRIKIIEILQNMGANLKISQPKEPCPFYEEPVMDIEVFSQQNIKPIHIASHITPLIIDEIPILAILASYASGKSTFEGLEELRHKESDRLQAVFDGLTANNIPCHMTSHTLFVYGDSHIVKGGGYVVTHHDHRIAMSFLVLGLATQNPVTVDDISSIQTSFPSFIKTLQDLGALITPANNTKEKNMPHIIVAIDGPSAAGKGTLAKRIAQEFSLKYLDTGLLYRITGFLALQRSVDLSSEEDVATIAETLTAQDIADNDQNPQIRNETTAKAASHVAAFPKVREALLAFQRNFAQTPSPENNGCILDGRDIGTTICPDAHIKLFITASDEARAQRRFLELQTKDSDITIEDVLLQLQQRDKKDSERAASPLTPASDALMIDTSHLSPNDVFEKIKPQISALLKEKA